MLQAYLLPQPPSPKMHIPVQPGQTVLLTGTPLFPLIHEREQIAIHGFVKNPKLLRPSQTPRPEQPRLRPSLFSSFLDCFQIDRPINTTRTLAPLAFLFGMTLHRLCQCDDSFQMQDFRRLNILL